MFSLKGNLFSSGPTLRGVGDWASFGLSGPSDCPPNTAWRDDEFGGACYPEAVDQQKVDEYIKKSNACPSGQYFDPFQNKCVKDDAAENIQALCPKGMTFGFDAKGNKVCKAPGGGVVAPKPVTPITPTNVGDETTDWLPIAGIGLLLAAGGYLIYRKRQKKAGFKRNWDEDCDWEAALCDRASRA